MNEKVLIWIDTEEIIVSLFQQYCVKHDLNSDPIDITKISRNISIFSGAIENYLTDYYGIDPEEETDA